MVPALTLDDAVAEFVEAKWLLGGKRLVDAVQGYLSTVAAVARVKVGDAVNDFLRERERLTVAAEGKRPALSPHFHKQQRIQLERYAAAFKMDVLDLGREYLDLYFREHLKPLGPKTRNHHRAALKLWFKWCLERDYLPVNHRLLETACLKGQPADAAVVTLYAATEFAALLEHAAGPMRAMVAIGGLAGLRVQELLRLDWADVWRRPGFIEVSARKAKTRQRRLVPIGPALTSWLEQFRAFTTGPLWAGGESMFQKHFGVLAKRAGVRRRDNALRHGYISCRLAIVHNEHQVAAEAGTSPALIHANYRELITAAEAKEWFAVLPEGAATNIVAAPGKEVVA